MGAKTETKYRQHDALAVALNAAVAVLLVTGASGCRLAPAIGGPAQAYVCTAELVNSVGDSELVSSTDPEFDGVSVTNECFGSDGSSVPPEEAWRLLIDGVANAGPFGGRPGGANGWCARSTTCRPIAVTDTTDTVPPCSDLSGLEPLDDGCTAGASCIAIAPEALELDPTNVSEVSAPATVAFENSCDASRCLRADETIFDDPLGNFAVVTNGCEATIDNACEPTDLTLGRELTSAGTPGDGCLVTFQFTPQSPGTHSAEYRAVSVADGALLPVGLQGDGAGTAPRRTVMQPRFCIDPGPSDCGTVSIGLVSDGPAGFRITATDFEVVSGTGFTVPPVLPDMDTVFGPGEEATYDVEWCRSASTDPNERLQVTTTTTTDEPGATRAFRTTIDAPAPCP